MSRIALLAAGVFVVAGVASGQLIDEYGGVGGAVEWVLRTSVVVSLVVVLVAAVVRALRIRRVLTAVASAVLAFFVVQPTVFAVYLSHLPTRRAVHDVDLGAAKVPVSLTTAGGLELSGWYVPSRNGAAVAVLHGTGSNRVGVADHARLLARHGYGVLVFDLHGHGESDGRSTSLPWRFRADADAALSYLRSRPDVRDGRLGIVGVSLGGEIGLDAAARHPEWRAAVLEGVQDGSSADPASAAVLTVLGGLNRVLSGSGPSASNSELVERLAPRPLLLISAGRGAEARANAEYAQHAALWNLPGASHAAALRTDPAGYERRVVGFLDRALTAAAPGSSRSPAA